MTTEIRMKLDMPQAALDCLAQYMPSGNRYGVFNKAMAGEPITYMEMRTFGGVITPIVEGKPWQLQERKKEIAFVVYWIDKPVTSVHWLDRATMTLTLMGMEAGQHNKTSDDGLVFFRKFYKKEERKRHHAKLTKKCR